MMLQDHNLEAREGFLARPRRLGLSYMIQSLTMKSSSGLKSHRAAPLLPLIHIYSTILNLSICSKSSIHFIQADPNLHLKINVLMKLQMLCLVCFCKAECIIVFGVSLYWDFLPFILIDSKHSPNSSNCCGLCSLLPYQFRVKRGYLGRGV